MVAPVASKAPESEVRQDEQEIAPADVIAMGDVLLNPAVPTDAIGMPVGR